MTTIKKMPHAPRHAKPARAYPAEAYDYEDDVTEEGVEEVRQKAAPIVEAEEWELIDGFERGSHT